MDFRRALRSMPDTGGGKRPRPIRDIGRRNGWEVTEAAKD